MKIAFEPYWVIFKVIISIKMRMTSCLSPSIGSAEVLSESDSNKTLALATLRKALGLLEERLSNIPVKLLGV
jgi:hypothetical protein